MAASSPPPGSPAPGATAGRGIRGIALFAHLPRFWRSPGGGPGAVDDLTLLFDPSDQAISIGEATSRYPTLAGDLATLQDTVIPLYRECDIEAAVEQNRHRRQQVILIVGGLLTSSFGAVQAALAHQVWPGIVVSSVAAATTAFASVGRQSGALDAYLASRLRAERLRSTYFNYLAHGDATVTDPRERNCALRDEITAIRYEDQGASR